MQQHTSASHLPRRILVTRPQAQNGPLVNALQAQSDKPLILPLLNIEVLNEEHHSLACQLIKNCVQQLDKYQHIICVSTNAADAAWFWVERYWPQLPAPQIWYAIGEATATTLKKYLPDVEQAGKAMNSESLLHNKNLQSIENHHVLIFRGNGGRAHLKQELEKKGAIVEYCEVYERQPIIYKNGELAQFLNNGIDILTVTSVETIQLLLDNAMIDGVNREIIQLPIIAPGKRVCDFAKAAGFINVIEAENAGLSAMLAAINNN